MARRGVAVAACALVLLAICASGAARPEDVVVQQVTSTTAPANDKANEINHQDNSEAKEEADAKTLAADVEKKDDQAASNDTKQELTSAAEIEKKDDQAASNDTKQELVQRVIERFPHAVLYGGTCGGTIISPTWILTAAHCTIFTSGRSVLAGTDDSWSDEGVRRRVKRLVIHPLFTVGPYWVNAQKFDIKQVGAHWDFLLVELEEPLPLDGKTMKAVALDDQPTTPEGLRVGYGGYGAEHHGETMRNEMHGMSLQILPDSQCQQELLQFDPNDMLCTQGTPPRYDSACNGDSGSGLVANGTLYGVASWVQDDAIRCFNGALVVFSRVSAVRDWIRQVTKI